ncbi:hypothetical protein [Lutibacter sp.]|uniref:hypothetical protein n=1 Tax=Lutibacter sp. TaxID=1925666 RepID=UPI0035657A0A
MKYLLIFIYVVINIFIFILNWDLFTAQLDVDLGFGMYSLPPFFLLQIFGLFIILLFAIVDGLKDLKRELKISELQNKIIGLEKDAEIAILKNKQPPKIEEPVVTIIPEIE